ncbi:MAG: M23 family metallopeptidase, partial [Desertimonas sp.]
MKRLAMINLRRATPARLALAVAVAVAVGVPAATVAATTPTEPAPPATTAAPDTTSAPPATEAPTTTPEPATTVAPEPAGTTPTGPTPTESTDATESTDVPESTVLSTEPILIDGAEPFVDNGEVRTITFPVAGPTGYANDFNACREADCSRYHAGTDIVGDRLQPVLAMVDGVVDHLLDHPTAGFGVVIRDADGWLYGTYHLNNDDPGTDNGASPAQWRFAAGIAPGTPVRAGQVIGFLGDSGNSESSVPHVHVDISYPDGTHINPYWSLRKAELATNCAAPVTT